jgi:hypothetical protein
VAQAREIIDLSMSSQKEIDCRRASPAAAMLVEAGAQWEERTPLEHSAPVWAVYDLMSGPGRI